VNVVQVSRLVSLKEEEAMLVLSRKVGQRFQVGQDVWITIVKIDRNSVRIGVEAPHDVAVFREEVAFEMPVLNCKAEAA
jgi:carbon storage regulator